MSEKRAKWIRERLSSPDAENDPDQYEWSMLQHAYDEEQRFELLMEEEEALFEYEEQKWLSQNPHNKIYDAAIALLEEVQKEGNEHINEVFIKMQIAYTVTIMESCLGEMIKSLTMSHSRYVANSITHIKELKKQTLPLTDLLDKKNIASKYVQDYLSEFLFHRISSTVNIYKAILQLPTDKPIAMKNAYELTRLRHDIVHRNGKTTEGCALNFDSSNLKFAFTTVRTFLSDMKYMIDQAIEYHANEEICRDLNDS
ncbi:hypothetical protein EYY91_15325 [Hafnia alvei]|nr:hypothetical protein EYY91_15325 [Hafnia alvei]